MRIMVILEVDDVVWAKYWKSWALMGVKEYNRLIEVLEDQIVPRIRLSYSRCRERALKDDTPEAYLQS
jgi:hypothetical protein